MVQLTCKKRQVTLIWHLFQTSTEYVLLYSFSGLTALDFKIEKIRL